VCGRGMVNAKIPPYFGRVIYGHIVGAVFGRLWIFDGFSERRRWAAKNVRRGESSACPGPIVSNDSGTLTVFRYANGKP